MADGYTCIYAYSEKRNTQIVIAQQRPSSIPYFYLFVIHAPSILKLLTRLLFLVPFPFPFSFPFIASGFLAHFSTNFFRFSLARAFSLALVLPPSVIFYLRLYVILCGHSFRIIDGHIRSCFRQRFFLFSPQPLHREKEIRVFLVNRIPFSIDSL